MDVKQFHTFRIRVHSETPSTIAHIIYFDIAVKSVSFSVDIRILIHINILAVTPVKLLNISVTSNASLIYTVAAFSIFFNTFISQFNFN